MVDSYSLVRGGLSEEKQPLLTLGKLNPKIHHALPCLGDLDEFSGTRNVSFCEYAKEKISGSPAKIAVTAGISSPSQF